MLNLRGQVLRRHLYFFLFVLGSLFVFWTPLKHLISFSLTHDYGSHIILIGPASAYLIYLKRREVFARAAGNVSISSVLLLVGTILWSVTYRYLPFRSDYFPLEIAGIILLWISVFNLCYGFQAFREARFPLLFLALMIPIPDFLIEKVIFVLQAGSAAVAYWLFGILRVPVLKEGFVFLLPALNIEVAKECSGIRSSLALLITTLLAGDLVLHSFWRKSLLVLATVPMLIFKNGVRIVTISLLTIHVDRGFMHGWLHTSGGVVFYVLGLLTLFPIMVLLKRGEIRTINRAGDMRCQAERNSAQGPEMSTCRTSQV